MREFRVGTVSSPALLAVVGCALAAGCAYDPYVVAAREQRDAARDDAALDANDAPSPTERTPRDRRPVAWPGPSRTEQGAPEGRAQDYCFRLAPGVTTPPATGGFALAYDPRRRQVLWTGVKTDTRPAMQTWRWDGAWTRLIPRGQPGPRVDHALAWDPAGGELVLFGGVIPNEPGRAWGDTWSWDGASWRALEGSRGPSSRALAVASSGPPGADVVLFDGRARETWVFASGRWARKSPRESPPSRRGHAMAYDPHRRAVVLFGGRDDVTGDLGDTWTFDGVSWSRAAAWRAPPPRAWAAMAWDPALGRVVLSGGEDQAGPEGRRPRGDLWLWDGRDWQEATCASGGPGPRSRARMVWDGARGVMVLVGGEGGARAWLADTWIH